MAEALKKAKAPAKPRKPATKKTASLEATTIHLEPHKPAVTTAEITNLAHRFWAERGYQDGYAEQDWLRAEHELKVA